MKLLVARSLMLLPLCVVLFSGSLFFSGSDLAYASTQSHQVRTFWVQVMDSCRQALPGAFFSYKVNGTTVHEGPTPGLKPLTVSVGIPCPVQRGNCVRSTTGCLAFTIPVPASGTKTYTIKETKSPHGYMPCTGGSVCPGGPQIITLHINASGAISATVLNVNPNRVPVIWPTQGKPYRGTASDPAVLHNFGIGNGNCDGDDDADDRLTGTPSIYCDSDND